MSTVKIMHTHGTLYINIPTEEILMEKSVDRVETPLKSVDNN